MSGFNMQFNAASVPPAVPMEALPEGWYNASVSDSEYKPNAQRTGHYAELTFTVLDGAYAGRKVRDRLNLDNPNQTAVEIAYRTLSAICHAAGTLQINSSADLHNRPLSIRLRLRPGEIGSDGKQYQPSNEIVEYAAYGQHATQQATPQPQAGPQQNAMPYAQPQPQPQPQPQQWPQQAAPQPHPQPQTQPQPPQVGPAAAVGGQPWPQPGAQSPQAGPQAPSGPQPGPQAGPQQWPPQAGPQQAVPAAGPTPPQAPAGPWNR